MCNVLYIIKLFLRHMHLDDWQTDRRAYKLVIAYAICIGASAHRTHTPINMSCQHIFAATKLEPEHLRIF